MNDKQKVAPEQITYALWLDWGMKIGFVAMVISFALYVLGVLEPRIPFADLPKYWVMPVGKYLEAANIQAGWSWVSLVKHGDFLNFIGIAFLSGITILCYARILPIFMAAKDKIFQAIVVAEILVLVLAASGILAGGH